MGDDQKSRKDNTSVYAFPSNAVKETSASFAVAKRNDNLLIACPAKNITTHYFFTDISFACNIHYFEPQLKKNIKL